VGGYHHQLLLLQAAPQPEIGIPQVIESGGLGRHLGQLALKLVDGLEKDFLRLVVLTEGPHGIGHHQR
jgi:hypothetical protein